MCECCEVAPAPLFLSNPLPLPLSPTVALNVPDSSYDSGDEEKPIKEKQDQVHVQQQNTNEAGVGDKAVSSKSQDAPRSVSSSDLNNSATRTFSSAAPRRKAFSRARVSTFISLLADRHRVSAYEEDDPSMVGRQGNLTEIPSSGLTEDDTRGKKVAYALNGFAVYTMKVFLRFPAPMLTVASVVLLKSYVAREYVNQEYSGEMLKFRYSDPPSIWMSLLTVFEYSLSGVFLWLSFAALLLSLWSWKVVKVPVCVLLLGMFVESSSWMVDLLLAWQKAPAPKIIFLAVSALTQLVLITTAFQIAGTRSNNPQNGVVWGVIVCFYAVLYFTITSSFGLVASAPDEGKALFVLIVNPILWETFALAPARLLARSLRNHDPTTTFAMPALPLVAKITLSRVVVTMIRDRGWLLAIMTASCFWELFFRTTLITRDKSLYFCIFKRWMRAEGNELAQFENPRNKLMRSASFSFETVAELVCIWAGVLMILLFDLSKHGVERAEPGEVVFRGVLQTCFELLTDLLSSLYIVAVEDAEFLMKAAYAGFTHQWLLVSLYLSTCITYTCTSVLGRLYCRDNAPETALWVQCQLSST